MRNLEDIEKDLAAAREALSTVEGTPAEVYSRIVGYYRSVRNWNRGKREEYGERRLYSVRDDELYAAAPSPIFTAEKTSETGPAIVRPIQTVNAGKIAPDKGMRMLLFIRAFCPNCSSAKSVAEKMGIPVNLIDTDTAEGMAEAVRRNVMSTPTVILLSPEGKELGRAGEAEAIYHLLDIAEPIAV